MMIFKKSIPRRTFLRGLGATVALPLLDGMVPAFGSAVDTAGKSPTRLSVVYVPNGMVMDRWTPKTEGANFEMSEILEPLTPFRDKIAVLSGLIDKGAIPYPGEGGGDHARGTGSFLTGVHPKKTEGSDIQSGISADQIVAKESGKETQVASLELATENSAELVGETDAGYSGAYINTLSWRTPTTALPMESQPRAVFERLFGDSDSTNPAERLARIQEDRSILDSVSQDVAPLLKSLGPTDRVKLTEYLDAIRDIERRIQKAEAQSSQELPAMDRPVGIPPTFEEHVKLMFDLQVLAFQTDLTRVITFMLGREVTDRNYREIGIGEAHHGLTHHREVPETMALVERIDLYQSQMFAYFLEKMRATPDGDGSLLDHSIILFGSSLSDANVHSHNGVPIALVGGGAGQIKGGRHIKYAGLPLSNLHLAILDMLKVPTEGYLDSKYSDATGKLEHLSLV
jgi:hypothetical protein